MIIIPIKWLFHWEYTQHFQTNPFILSITHHLGPQSGLFSQTLSDNIWAVITVVTYHQPQNPFQWIGLRENLQETIDVPIKYGAFL